VISPAPFCSGACAGCARASAPAPSDPPRRERTPRGRYGRWTRDLSQCGADRRASSPGGRHWRDVRGPGTGCRTTSADRAGGANLNFFFTHDLPAIIRYKLDVAMFEAVATRIRPAGGAGSRGTWPFVCAAALANRLGTELVELPSDHIGYMTHPRAYAASLRKHWRWVRSRYRSPGRAGSGCHRRAR